MEEPGAVKLLGNKQDLRQSTCPGLWINTLLSNSGLAGRRVVLVQVVVNSAMAGLARGTQSLYQGLLTGMPPAAGMPRHSIILPSSMPLDHSSPIAKT